MTEVQSAQISPHLSDESALQTLLSTLTEDLPSNLQSLLSSSPSSLTTDILSYLDEICNVRDPETYLSTHPPSSLAPDDKEQPRTLIQDIAELEAQIRIVDDELKALIVSSQDSILKNREELEQGKKGFMDEFVPNFKELWDLVNEGEIDDDQENESEEMEEEEEGEEEEEDPLQIIIEKDQTTQPNPLQTHDLPFHFKVAQLKSQSQHTSQIHLTSILHSMDQLHVLMTLPSLTAQCIKTGHYSEALELHSYVRRLAIRFQDTPVILQIESQVTQEISGMLGSLLRLLRTNMRQSSVIKTISYLRRIRPFSTLPNDQSEAMLKRVYLHARYEFVKGELEALDPLRETNGGEERYLKRCVEVIREFAFQGCVVYRNLFEVDQEDEKGVVQLKLEQDDETMKESEAKSEYEPEVEIREEATKVVEEAEKEGSTVQSTESEEVKETDPQRGNGLSEEAESDSNKDINEEDRDQESGETMQLGETEKQETQSEEPITEEPTQNKLEIIIPEPTPTTLQLYAFLRRTLALLTSLLSTTYPLLPPHHISSSRDSIILQLIYCAHSLGRLDGNFGTLFTVLVLNLKDQDGMFLINRDVWSKGVEKQRALSASFTS